MGCCCLRMIAYEKSNISNHQIYKTPVTLCRVNTLYGFMVLGKRFRKVGLPYWFGLRSFR